MDRTLFLNMCRSVAVLRGGVEDIKDVPDNLKVRYKCQEFYPVKYELSFRRDGSVRHTAVIHELKANAVWYVELADIEQAERTET